MTASLAYRNNAEAINRGDVPEKYRRLLPFIRGERILEIGAAEGVLSLLLAERGASVTALELRQERHDEALKLQARWTELGRPVQTCKMELGNIRQRFDLLDNIDTLVAVRSVYYLRGDAPVLMSEAMRRGVQNIVLCGNVNRAARWLADKIPADDGLGEWNRYASFQGMAELIEDAGYELSVVISEGDPIVTGRRP